MRIISNFKDYYDSALAYGVDMTHVFQRNTEDFYESDFNNIFKRNSFFSDLLFKKDHYEVQIKVLVFCGKNYPFVVCHDCKTVKKDMVFYHLDDFYNTFEKYNSNLIKRWKQTKNNMYYFSASPKLIWDELLAINSEEIHFKYKTPILIIQNSNRKLKYSVNPRLETIYFYKKVDSFTAFQEIDMYISGVLGLNAPLTIELNNSEKIKKAGFNKYNFRKIK